MPAWSTQVSAVQRVRPRAAQRSDAGDKLVLSLRDGCSLTVAGFDGAEQCDSAFALLEHMCSGPSAE